MPAIKKKPAPLGADVDRLFKMDQERDQLKERLKEIDARYSKLEAKLLEQLPLAKLDGATGKLATAKVDRNDYPNAVNWGRIRKYITKEDAWDLLQKRLSATACRERWNAKLVIPGIKIFTKVSLKLSRRKGKKV